MTGNFVFEEALMGPFFRVKDAVVSCAEQWAAPAPWLVEESEERVVRNDQSMNVHFHWINEGPGIAIINPAAVEWHLDLYVEGMGLFPDGHALSSIQAFVPIPGNIYNVNLVLAPPAAGWPVGVYELVATLKLVQKDPISGAIIRTMPMVGFSELGKLAVYQG